MNKKEFAKAKRKSLFSLKYYLAKQEQKKLEKKEHRKNKKESKLELKNKVHDADHSHHDHELHDHTEEV